MKKIIIILMMLCLIGCDHQRTGNEITETVLDETLLKVQSRDTLGTVYGDLLLEKEITILSGGEVIDVVEVFIEEGSIKKYRVLLNHGHQGYVSSDEFHIVEVLVDDYSQYLKPEILLDKIKLGKENLASSYIQSNMQYDLYIDGVLVKEPFRFVKGLKYKIQAKPISQFGTTYESDIEVLDSEVNHVYCKVRLSKNVESEEITRFLYYNQYKDRIQSAEISLEGDQLVSWYSILLDDGSIGYSNDNLLLMDGYKHLTVKTSKETLDFNDVNMYKLEGYNHILQVEDQESDENHLIDLKSGFRIEYTDSILLQDNIMVLKKLSEDQSHLELVVMDYEDEFKLLASSNHGFNHFENLNFENNGDITFDAFYEKDFNWPFDKENTNHFKGMFKSKNGTYELWVKNEDKLNEPLLDNIKLYQNKDATSNVVTQFDSEDIRDVYNEHLVDIVDGKLVFWFKITTDKDDRGYAYRSLFAYEKGLIDPYKFYYKFADGSHKSLVDMELHYRDELTLHDDLIHYGIYGFDVSNYYSNHSIGLSYDDVHIEDKKLLINYAKSSDGQMIISKTYGSIYDEKVGSTITIYKKGEYKPTYSKFFKDARTDSFIWTDKDTISFFFQTKNGHGWFDEHPSVMKRLDGEWIIKSEYNHD